MVRSLKVRILMNNWVIYTAFRHLKTKRREKGDTSTLLSIIGILSGVMTMITVIGVMNGFQGSNIDKRVEIGSAHITLEPKSKSNNLDTDIINNIEGVKVSYYSSEFITAVSDEWDGEILGVQVKSLPSEIYEIDNNFREWVTIKSGQFDLSSENSIIIGQSFAYTRHISVGDKVSLLSLKDDGTSSGFSPKQVEFVVKGVYRSGSVEYDESLLFISNDSALAYFINDGEFNYQIKIDNRNRYNHYTSILKKYTNITENYNIKNWREYNSSYYNALKNEKDLMTVLIGLIFLVVGINIYNSIRRSVYLRFEEISVLKTMGATSFNIRVVFILESFFIGLIGATIGIILGLWIVTNINLIFEILEYGINFIFSLINGTRVSFYGSQFFYLNEVPVEVYFTESVMVYLSAIATSIIAAYTASKRISTIRPGEVIRNE